MAAIKSIAAALSALVLSWTFFYLAGQLVGRLSGAGGL